MKEKDLELIILKKIIRVNTFSFNFLYKIAYVMYEM